MLLAAVLAALAQPDAVHQLNADLLSRPSATETLTRWCADLGLAEPPVVVARREPETEGAPSWVRARLHAGRHERIVHRQVHLMCGTHDLSDAHNWYRPGRLTPEMNRALETTTTPFGAVVRPLDFTRTTLGVVFFRRRPGAPYVLRHTAVLQAGGAPFSLVIELYTPVLAARAASNPATTAGSAASR